MAGVEPMVSYSRGSMNELLHKLTKLKTRQITALPPDHVEVLLEALSGLNGDFVDKVAERQETDGQVKAWMKQVRQLVVNIEDWVEPKLLTSNTDEPDNDKLEDFQTQISEACDRCTRYELLSKAPTDPAVPVRDVVPSNVTTEPHRLLLEEKPVGLVGVDGPTEKLVEKLTDVDNQSLKVVSIVGVEGLGKTTLAKEIYSKLQGKFDCQAFVSVGRRTSVSTILVEILHQVKPEPKGVPRAKRGISEEMQAITDLKEYLDTKKRYLIIIDGLWSTRDWEVINCALPDNNCGSRVLTTTCIMNVAESCALDPIDVHPMEALSKVHSEEIFGVHALSGVESKEIFCGKADDILKISGGVPLAIIVAAGLLPRKSVELIGPKMLWKSDSMTEGMKKILYMSYADLSVPLKSCFMYLSVFPEDYTIKKDRLIRLWRAEGFIPENTWGTGERYFKELISRKLIQPVFSYEDDQAVGCTVHAVVLDFIASLSKEQNFVTVGAELKSRPLKSHLSWSLTATMGAEWTSGPFLCYETVRRLSLHLHPKGEGNNLVSGNVDLSRVRSLIAFGNSFSTGSIHIPDLKEFKLIRVLDLEGTNLVVTYALIANLFLLRYLGLAGLSFFIDDKEDTRELDHLQTLDIRKTKKNQLPSLMHLMPNLLSVLGDGLRFSSRSSGSSFEYVQNLEELSTMDISDRTTRDGVKKLVKKSKKLRMLGVSIGDSRTGVIPFLDELRQCKLESLVIEAGLPGHCPWLEQWAPWPTLRRFQLKQRGHSQTEHIISRVPNSWASLDVLTHLDVSIVQLNSGDLSVLSKLSNLILLKLRSQGYEESGCSVGEDGFQKLEVAWFKCPDGEMGLHFAPKAMPRLRKLRLEFNARKTLKKQAFGEFPSKLMQVDVTISCRDSTPSDAEGVEHAIRKQIAKHIKKPNLSFELINQEEPVEMNPLGHPQRSSALLQLELLRSIFS